MINVGIKLVQRPPDAAKLMKNINFGIAKGLTDTAKDGQKAVVDSLKSTFTLRGSWWNQNMKHGIKITPAKRDNLQSAVHTLADWLEPHEKGGTRTPRGNTLAVPTGLLRPRGSKKILRGVMRPRALLASGKAFILDTKRGKVIARLKGKDRLEILYGLEPRVRIRKQSTFYEPINKVVKRNLDNNIRRGIAYAFKTMR